MTEDRIKISELPLVTSTTADDFMELELATGVKRSKKITVSDLFSDTTGLTEEFNFTHSSFYYTGGLVTENSNLDGTIDISECSGWIKTTDSAIGEMESFTVEADSAIALSAGNNIVCVNYNSGSPQFKIETVDPNHTTIFPIGQAYKATNHLHLIQSGHRFTDLPAKAHKRFLEVDGRVRASGLVTTEGSESLSIQRTAGVAFQGINEYEIDAFDSGDNDNITAVNQGTKKFTVAGDTTDCLSHGSMIYVDGSTGNDGTYHVQTFEFTGGNTEIIVEEAIPDATVDGHLHCQVFSYWHYDFSTTAWVHAGQTGDMAVALIDVTYWNDIDNATEFQTFTPNRYGTSWVYQDLDGDVHVVYGQGNYTATQALNQGPPASLPDIINEMCLLIAKIVFQEGDAALTTFYYPWETVFSAEGGSDHNGLGGLQGGTASEYYHLSAEDYGYVDGVTSDIQTQLDAKVNDTGNETIAGIKTFSSFPITPSAAPTTDYQVANKKYVDDAGGGGVTQYSEADAALVDKDTLTVTHASQVDHSERIISGSVYVVGAETNYDVPFTTEGNYDQGDVKGTAVNFQVDTADTSGHFEDAVNAGVTIGAGNTEDRIQVGVRFYCDSQWLEITAITDDGELADEVEFTQQDGDPATIAEDTFVVTSVYGTEFPNGAVLLNESGTAGAGNDENTHLLLHCEGADTTTTFTDSSTGGANSPHTATAVGNAQIDTAQYKWGAASGLFDGTGDYLTVPDSADWDFFGNGADSWTIDFWVKHADHVGQERYIEHYEDAGNVWRIYHTHGGGITLQLRSGASNVIVLTTAAGEITDTDWHHLAFIKVIDEYGIYLDGAQVGYIQDADTDTFAGLLFIASGAGGTNAFDGHLDEFRIQKSNYFEAAPNGTPDDTIVVPTEAYGASTAAVPVDQFYIVATNDGAQIDCETCTDVGDNAWTVTETLDSQTIYYSVSWDDRITFRIFDDTVDHVGWRPIAKLDGVWKFNDAAAGWDSENWVNAPVDSQESALESAFQIAANQMTGTEMTAISQANATHANDGWDTDVDTTDYGVGLLSDTATENPSLSLIRFELVAAGQYEPIPLNNSVEIWVTTTENDKTHVYNNTASTQNIKVTVTQVD